MCSFLSNLGLNLRTINTYNRILESFVLIRQPGIGMQTRVVFIAPCLIAFIPGGNDPDPYPDMYHPVFCLTGSSEKAQLKGGRQSKA